MKETATQLRQLFTRRGHSEYGGESVTQLEHALQCGLLAEQSGASTELVVAALLHDVGHLLHNMDKDAPNRGIDDVHEELGGRFLGKHFSLAVCNPVRLHVAAKRYLCTREPSYLDELSPPSILSFHLQGGVMSEAECREFESTPHWEEALELRKWDDLAKQVDLETPDLEHFLSYLNQL